MSTVTRPRPPAVLTPPVIPAPLQALRGLVNPAVWMTLTITCTMFSGLWHDLGEPIPLDRVCFILTLLTLALRSPLGAKYRFRFKPVHVAIIAAVVYLIGNSTVVGTITSHDGSFALLDRYGLVPFISFMIAPIVYRTARDRTILLVVLTIVGAYLGLTALFETLNVNALVWPRYILNPNIGIQLGRARGPFAEASANGMAMWVCVVSAVLLAVQCRRWCTRVLCGLVALLCVAGILFTLTRGIWLGATIGGLVPLAFYRPLRRFLLPVVLVGFAAVTIALATVPSLEGNVQQRANSNLTVWDRYNQDHAAINMFKVYPLFGVGWQEFGPHADEYYSFGKNYPLVTVNVVHNLFLSNLVELGLVGMVFWLAALVLGLCGGLVRRVPPELRIWQYGLMAILVEWFVSAQFGPLAYAFANTSLWVFAGIAFGPTAWPVVRLGDPNPEDAVARSAGG